MGEIYNEMPMTLSPVTLSPVQETTKDRLERQKKHYMDRVADIDEALSLLAKYPDIEKLTDLLRRI